MRGAVPALPNTFSWLGAQLNTDYVFTFTLPLLRHIHLSWRYCQIKFVCWC